MARLNQVIYLSFMTVKQFMIRVRRASAYTVCPEEVLYGGPCCSPLNTEYG